MRNFNTALRAKMHRAHQKIGMSIEMPTRSPYRKGDCCFGCPYKLCPSRPTRPMEMERPNCTWEMYSKMNR